MASLRELQRAFAAAIRPNGPGDDVRRAHVPGAHVPSDDIELNAEPAGVAVRPLANLDVYRNNSDWQFRNALSSSFPVLRRRVGDDYFRQLAVAYRARFPSRSGDLHWVGRHFADFLTVHLADGDYAWLADLARLEWAREMASVSEAFPAVGPDALAAFAPEELEHLVFELQPSLHLGSSAFPVVTVWMLNQAENAPPVDQSLGSEQYMVLSRNDGVTITRLSPPLLSYLSALDAGAPLGEAMASAGFDEAGLLGALQFVFAESLVRRVHSAKR